MAVTIDQTRVDEIRAIADDLAAQMDSYEALLILSGGVPVVWADADRLQVMKWATQLAFASETDLACYPLSVSASIFVP